MVEYQLTQISNVVILTILSQDIKDYVKEWEASNGITIRTSTYPSLDINTIYLRGDSKFHDYQHIFKCFTSEKQAEAYKSKVSEALREFNQRKVFNLERDYRKYIEKKIPLRTRAGHKVYIADSTEDYTAYNIGGLYLLGLVKEARNYISTSWRSNGLHCEKPENRAYDIVGFWKE